MNQNKWSSKIVIPIIENKKEEILNEVTLALKEECDMIEWRLDYFQDLLDIPCVLEVLEVIFQKVQCAKKELLVTIRTLAEGGADVTSDMYKKLCAAIIKTNNVDLIDVEFSLAHNLKAYLLDLAKKKHIKVVLSYHDFNQMPDYENFETMLEKMLLTDVFVYKIALIPKTSQEVLNLLQWQLNFQTKYPDKHFVVIGMGEKGKLTRIGAQITGSYLNFASRKKISAPGQINIRALVDFFN